MNKNKNKKGFALLYAIFTSSIILAIAIGVSSIAYKEVVFGTSAKDANDAFYAADSASECALFFDKTDNANNSYVGNGPRPECNGSIVSTFTQYGASPDQLISTFKVFNFGSASNPNACANVTVLKHQLLPDTTITAVGYNNATVKDAFGNPTDCFPNLTSVQRVLELSYK